MKYLIAVLLPLHLTLAQAQKKENPIAFYEAQIGKTWVIDAKWGDGSPFKQELTLTYGLQGQVVYVHTKGYIDQERTVIGDRNFGVRKYDEETGKVLFWEFDAFGGVTTGEVVSQGRDLWYIYQYGEQTIADIWEYLDDETYAFRVVSFDNNEVGDMYLKGAYRLKE